MRYSIILATLVKEPQHIEMTEKCIDMIGAFSDDYELIIVDDGSPQDTRFLKDAADTYIRHKEMGRGCAVSWNDGLRIARGDFLVVISDDITVRSGWLEVMERGFTRFPRSLASMPAVENMPVGKEPEEKRVWVPASCFMLKRETIERVGFFDEQFRPFNYEDVDYWTRVSQAGGTIARDYSVQVGHGEGKVIHTIDGHEQIDKENRERYLRKWGFDPIPILYGDGKFPWE